ncbi:ABC transporter permease [Rubellimicrobium aerolatum]|uniref:ABC transporter permease n=1 Tax=Rubellimicrobium aerolatum TaxID=490979 RepID=A0ABW0SAX9_9RHOB|nr:FtsX-like permease family protein [Rubellimicrobium aerolatum]MBP1805405.1 putative ABC transport system permease protein [Rubellimicrobium aerolatum]
MTAAARLAWRELRGGLRGGLRGFRIFLLCLALGVAAIAAVGTVRAAIESGLDREGARLLGGDAEAELTYRFATPEERDWLAGLAPRVSEVVDFRSLAVADPTGRADRALTQVKAVDDLYPLIGEVRLDPPQPLDRALAGGPLPGLVMERALVDRLALEVGDRVRLGTQDFTLTAVLLRYPDNSTAGFGLGPRTLVRTADLAGSGLLAEGTLFNTAYRLDLPEGADLDALAAQAESLWRDRGMRWRDARDGAGGTQEVVERLGRFLVLVGLSGLAVGGVGVSAAVGAYLSSKAEVIATLRTLGASRATIFASYFLQIGALGLVGVALGLVLGAGLPLLLAPWIESRLPVPAVFALYGGPLAEALVYGVLALLLFTLWPLARAGDVRAAALFRDALSGGRRLPRPPYLLATALILATLLAVASWFQGSASLTLWTAAGIAGALLLLALAAALARVLARRLSGRARGRPALRLALGSIGARGGEATPVVLSLGLGLAVLAAVGQIDGNLRRAITGDLPAIAPSYFVVDIQPDQIEDFRARLSDRPGVERVEAAPMLRGIITRIDGRPAEEVAGEHWTLNGDRGLTYSAAPPPGTTITAGAWWPEDYAGPPLVSFAAEAGEELGLRLGQRLTVNVLGRDIEATIASFRDVDFRSAGIGFILSLNPSALAGAPHSWIATVYAEESAEGPLLRDLAEAYPNITAIRVRDAVDEAQRIVAGATAAIRVAALATLATGFLVILGAAAAGERARAWEAAILKTLGAERRLILRSFALRAALLGLAAAAVALGAGLLGAWAVMTFVMDGEFRPVWGSALAIVLGGTLATLLTGLLFALRPLAARPARILRARE